MDEPKNITEIKRKIAELEDSTRKAKEILKKRRQKHDNRARSRLRKLQTRRERLTGQAVLAEAKYDPDLRRRVDLARSRRLKNPRERELFGLPPLDEPPRGEGPVLTGFAPAMLNDDGSWGAKFTGDPATLPPKIIGRRIRKKTGDGMLFEGIVTEEVEQEGEVIYRMIETIEIT